MTSRYQIVEATAAHVRALSGRLRAEDALEITALGENPRAALWHSWRGSPYRRTVLVGDAPAAMWGVHGDLLGVAGVPWLLTAPEIEHIPVALVREGRREVAAMLRLYPRIENYVMASYARAVRFIGMLGFTVGEPVSLHGVAFRPFRLEREHWLEEAA